MDKTLRIAQFMDSFYPHVDGVVNVVDNYAKFFSSVGDNCCVYVPKCGKYIDDFPYDVCRCPSLYTGKSFYLPGPDMSMKMRSKLKKGGVDIIHAHTPFMMGHYALKMAKKLKVPFVATFHTKYYDDFLAYTGSKKIADFGKNYLVKFYQQADAVWSVSKGTAQTLYSYGYQGDIQVMPNGVDIGSQYPEDAGQYIARANEAYPLPCEGFPILFVGQLIWQKNLRLILDTVALLRRQGVPVSLTIPGSGDNSREIMEYARSIGIEHCTAFLGRVSDRALLQGLYLRSKLFFFPSSYDNAPITLQEASLNRLPGLLLRGSNAAENIQEGVNGYLCVDDPDDAAKVILRLIEGEEGRAAAGMAASQTIVNRWEDLMNTVRELYIQLPQKGRQDCQDDYTASQMAD